MSNYTDKDVDKKPGAGLFGVFVSFQKFLIKYGIIRYKARQEYHIGWLAPGKTLQDLRLYLHSEWGFGNHFESWEDEGEVLNWRKLIGHGSQYHLRVFKDGEMRGHLEVTPESGVLNHIFKRGMKEAQNEFFRFLGDFVVRDEVMSELKADPDAYSPRAEITKEFKLGKDDNSIL